MATASKFTQNARALITNYFLNNASTAAQPTAITWGINPTGASAGSTDIGMFTEGQEARIGSPASVTVTQTTSATTNDTILFVGTITCTTVGGENIYEVGVFDSTTAPYSASITGGTITSGGTVCSVSSTFTPANNTYCQLATGEIIQVTAGHNTQALTVTRNQLTSLGQTANPSVGQVLAAGSPPGGTAIVGGSMFMHSNFNELALNQNDSIKFSISVQFQ